MGDAVCADGCCRFANISARHVVEAGSTVNGSALPSWLQFDANTRTFSAVPEAVRVGLLQFAPWALRPHPIEYPPSTISVCPVTKFARWDARNATASAVSSGWPMRLSAVFSVATRR